MQTELLEMRPQCAEDDLTLDAEGSETRHGSVSVVEFEKMVYHGLTFVYDAAKGELSCEDGKYTVQVPVTNQTQWVDLSEKQIK